MAVKKGTTGHRYAATALKQAGVLVLDKESAAVMEVAQGRADAFIYDSLSVYRSHARHPDTTRALLRPFRKETWAVGLRRGDDDLRRQVNDFLNQFRSDGGFERLGDEFLPGREGLLRAGRHPVLLLKAAAPCDPALPIEAPPREPGDCGPLGESRLRKPRQLFTTPSPCGAARNHEACLTPSRGTRAGASLRHGRRNTGP